MANNSILPRGFKAEAERLSESYRTKLGVDLSDPLDAFTLADYLNVQVFSVSEIFDGDGTNPNLLTLNNTSKFSAMWAPNKDGEKIIIHNANHSKYRQQSNLMHELAHIIRKHEVPDDAARLCAQLGLHYYNSLHEEEAKYLGGCLQITRSGLLKALKNKKSINDISELFVASIEMVKYRINTSGVMKQLNYSSSRYN